MAEYIVRMEPEHPEFQVLIGAVLRCRDCRYFVESTCECRQFSHEEVSPIDGEPYECREAVEPDGFCAWGEPREV